MGCILMGCILMGCVQGKGRQRGSLFPPLEQLVPEDHLSRVIEAYAAEVDLPALGFCKAQRSRTDRPAYGPADLLKHYLHGYFQRIRSSR